MEWRGVAERRYGEDRNGENKSVQERGRGGDNKRVINPYAIVRGELHGSRSGVEGFAPVGVTQQWRPGASWTELFGELLVTPPATGMCPHRLPPPFGVSRENETKSNASWEVNIFE